MLGGAALIEIDKLIAIDMLVAPILNFHIDDLFNRLAMFGDDNCLVFRSTATRMHYPFEHLIISFLVIAAGKCLVHQSVISKLCVSARIS
jgi:hypothetical protein